jgi:hypothetical protein
MPVHTRKSGSLKRDKSIGKFEVIKQKKKAAKADEQAYDAEDDENLKSGRKPKRGLSESSSQPVALPSIRKNGYESPYAQKIQRS